MERPEHEACVRHGDFIDHTKPNTQSYCGRDTAQEFAFTDPTHAILSRGKSRLTICPRCVLGIIGLLVER